MIKITVDEKLSALADAIRSKTGSTEFFTLDTMATEIESIKLGEDIDAHNAQTNTHNALTNRTTALTEADTNLEELMIRGISVGTEDMIENESDLPSGVIYLKLKDGVNITPNKKTIEFSVIYSDSGNITKNYNAKENMTWKEWVSSNYNVDSFEINGDIVYYNNVNNRIIDVTMGVALNANFIIVPNEVYMLANFAEQ